MDVDIENLSEPGLHELLESHYDYSRPEIKCQCMQCLSAKHQWYLQYGVKFPTHLDWAYQSKKFSRHIAQIKYDKTATAAKPIIK